MILHQPFSSDIVFLRDAATGKPEDLVEPGIEVRLRRVRKLRMPETVPASGLWNGRGGGAANSCGKSCNPAAKQSSHADTRATRDSGWPRGVSLLSESSTPFSPQALQVAISLLSYNRR